MLRALPCTTETLSLKRSGRPAGVSVRRAPHTRLNCRVHGPRRRAPNSTTRRSHPPPDRPTTLPLLPSMVSPEHGALHDARRPCQHRGMRPNGQQEKAGRPDSHCSGSRRLQSVPPTMPKRTGLDRVGPLWTTLGHSPGPLWTTLDHFGPLWTTLDHFGPLWASMGQYGPAWATLDRHRPANSGQELGRHPVAGRTGVRARRTIRFRHPAAGGPETSRAGATSGPCR